MLERKIIIGLITDTKFLAKLRPNWNPLLLESSTARLISGWCINHFDKYKKAPNKEMETIFFEKAKELSSEMAEEIEEDILPDLSEEFLEASIDMEFLYTETIQYLKTRQYLIHSQQIINIIENGKGDIVERLKEVEDVKNSFHVINDKDVNTIDLSNRKDAKIAIRKAFQQIKEPLIHFPKQLGKFWGEQFVAGGFIGFLAIEKRGKTFLLMALAMMAAKQGKKVAFFQAGDMNQSEQLKRIAIYLTRRSTLEKYCEEHFEPVRDCIRNQKDDCDKKEREGDFSPFEAQVLKKYDTITITDLIEAYKNNSDYTPCSNCKDYDLYRLGTAWIRKVDKCTPLEEKDAQKAVKEFFHDNNRYFKLSTHPSTTLSIAKIENILDGWEEDNFVPDIIFVDYADILVPSIKIEFRHQQNQIWKELRKLSQTPRKGILPLVITPTQADSAAYKTYRLQLDNFSEDKRKYAHVTAMYGLNQDPEGREKGIGLLRINELLLREGEWSNSNEITVLQNLRRGRAIIGSYF